MVGEEEVWLDLGDVMQVCGDGYLRRWDGDFRAFGSGPRDVVCG
jgi:hypothetical protein